MRGNNGYAGVDADDDGDGNVDASLDYWIWNFESFAPTPSVTVENGCLTLDVKHPFLNEEIIMKQKQVVHKNCKHIFFQTWKWSWSITRFNDRQRFLKWSQTRWPRALSRLCYRCRRHWDRRHLGESCLGRSVKYVKTFKTKKTVRWWYQKYWWKYYEWKLVWFASFRFSDLPSLFSCERFTLTGIIATFVSTSEMNSAQYLLIIPVLR